MNQYVIIFVVVLVALAAFVAFRRTSLPADRMERFLATNGELGPADRDSVVPIVRPLGDEAFGRQPEHRRQALRPVAEIRASNPFADAGDIPVDQLPIMDHLVGNLSVRYAVDGEKMMVNVSPQILRQLGVSREELLELGVKNLHQRYPDAQIHRSKDFGMLTGSGDLESSWLLDFRFWGEEAKRFKGELVASVPSREVMVWGDSASPERIEDLRVKAREVHDREIASNRAVSTLLYVWRDGGWEVYGPSDAP